MEGKKGREEKQDIEGKKDMESSHEPATDNE